MKLETVRISRRFQGPPRSGNGGYACGMTASRLRGAITVRLKAPPPLETDLQLESDENNARLLDGDMVVAEAWKTEFDLCPPDPPPFDLVSHASEFFIGFEDHQFPRCFVCGPDRSDSDGLRIFPGPLPGTNVIAAPWTPDPSLANPSGHVDHIYLWSALDCPTGFALVPLPKGLGIVLGELSASVVRNVPPGDALAVCRTLPAEFDRMAHSLGNLIA